MRRLRDLEPGHRAVGVLAARRGHSCICQLIVAGSFLATVPFSSVSGLGAAGFLRHEADWLRARPFGSALFVIAGVSILATVASGR
jgi:hypothetical protein